MRAALHARPADRSARLSGACRRRAVVENFAAGLSAGMAVRRSGRDAFHLGDALARLPRSDSQGRFLRPARQGISQLPGPAEADLAEISDRTIGHRTHAAEEPRLGGRAW